MVSFPPCVGEGCVHCKGVTDNFIVQAQKVHGDKYSYEKTKISCQDVKIPKKDLAGLLVQHLNNTKEN